ncbi:MAG: hypothetical protein EOP21_13350 [Hyphomicrobiales bacterium]|nr:MAG: hypothetical protein EOP21_13350 [Hyphomicrobiales bacterium]
MSSAMFVAVGASAVTFSASVNTLLQLRAPPEMRGRLVSMINLLIPSPFGPMLTGAAAAVLGVGWAVFANGLLCCVGIGFAYLYLLRHRKAGMNFEYEPPEDQPLPIAQSADTTAEIDAEDTGVR